MPHLPERTFVRVYLEETAPDTDRRLSGPPPIRVLELNAQNNWSAQVGRATSTGSGPDEEEDNAYFRSRVVSREHAYITANPDTRIVTVKDAASMHGTHVHSQRLRSVIPCRLAQDDIVLFGAPVERGDQETFQPIAVKVTWDWHTDKSSNTFTVPDDSEDEMEEEYDPDDRYNSEEEYEIRDEPRRFIVPDSDHSIDAISVASSESVITDVDSPSSSHAASQGSIDLASKSADATSPEEFEMQHRQVEPQQGCALVHQQSPMQSGLSIAELLENKVERMNNSEIDPFSVYERVPPSEDEDDGEYHGEEVDDFDEVDEFEDESPPPVTSPTLHVPSVPQPQRDPSPSDAAMVKPLTSPIRAPPFGDSSTSQNLPSVKPEFGGRSGCAWAGHNAVLYDPPMPFYNQFANVPPPLHFQDTVAGFAPMMQVGYEGPSHVVDPFQPFQYQSPAQPCRKRKADEMSEDLHDPELRIEHPKAEVKEPPTIAPEHIARTEMETNIRAVPSQSVADMIKSPAPVVAESARKKQKTSKDDSRPRTNKGTSLTRYAVTALAGAALGAVGTVLGLAALPQDFFI